MAIYRFETGSSPKIKGTFRTPKTAIPPSTLIDPDIVTLTIRSPDKTVETRTFGVDAIENPSVGVYTSVLVLEQEGTYHWRWRGANGLTEAGVVSGQLDSVREPNF